jgi:hypothetical protein
MDRGSVGGNWWLGRALLESINGQAEHCRRQRIERALSEAITVQIEHCRRQRIERALSEAISGQIEHCPSKLPELTQPGVSLAGSFVSLP